jgi:hypothetical protein
MLPNGDDLVTNIAGHMTTRSGRCQPIEDFIINEFEGLEEFHEAMGLLDDHRPMKVVFWPNGKG